MTEPALPNMGDYESDAAAVIAFAEARTVHHVEPVVEVTDGLELWATSRGLEPRFIDRRPYADAPARTRGVTRLANIKSFCEWVTAHQVGVPGPDVYADLGNMCVTAVLNPATRSEPAWQDYRAHVALTYTAEWVAWSNLHGTYIDQEAFGLFVADWSHTFLNPGSTVMSMLAEGLVIHSKSKVAQAVRLRDGSRHIVFDESDETRDADGNDYDVPSTVTLRMPIFDGGDACDITASFRFRRRGAEVAFGVHFPNINGIVETAFRDAREVIAGALGVSIYEGQVPDAITNPNGP